MSSLGDKIKSVFGGSDHTSETAQRTEGEHRTPGAFPSEDSAVRGGADQPHMGGRPVPSSGSQDLGGTSQDPGLVTGSSEHNKLHKKDDPRGNTGYPSHSTAGTGTSALATDRHGRPDTSSVPGTGIATGPGTAGGVHASELGSDRSGSKPEDFTSGLEGTRAGHTGHGTSGLTGSQHGTSGLTGSQHGTSGLTGSQHGTSGLTGNQHGAPGTTGGQYGSTGSSNNPYGTPATQQSQSGSHSGTGAGLAAGAAALAGHDRDSHNTVQNGREKSQIGSGSHEEPYWGNLPGQGGEGTHGTQGAGVYNTVTGHGSGENSSSQHRNLPLRTGGAEDTSRTGTSGSHGVTPGAGVYNTVTGHGSNNEHDRAHDNSADRHDRAFPLGTGSNTREGDDSHHRQGEGALGAGAAGAAAGYGASKLGHHDDNNPQRIGEHGSTSSTNPTTSHGSTGGASYLPNTSGTHDNSRTGSTGGAGALGGVTATPQEQTIAGGKDPQRVAASQPTTHGTGSMLDIGDVGNVGTGPAHKTAGPHKSDLLNKADPRVDSDLDGSRGVGSGTGTHGTSGVGTHGTSGLTGPSHGNDQSHTGRNTAGLAGAGAAAGAAYGAHEHNKHDRDTVGSGIDPSHADSRSRDTGNSSGGLLHRHKDEPTTSTGHHHTTKEDYKDPNAHHHDSKLLGFLHHNKDDKIVGQDAHGSSLPATTQHTGTGYDNTRSTHDDHTGRNAALAGAGAAGAGYGASRLGQHHNEPSIGQRDTGVTGSHGTSGLGSNTGISGSTEGTHGPHSSRIANAADPRVDSDRDGSRAVGSGTSTHGASGLTGTTHGNEQSHTGRNVAGLGAAAGAGYGASHLGHHDNDPTYGRDNTRNTPGQGQYNTLNDGTPSGISTGANHGTSTGINDTRGAPSSTGITGGTHSHGGNDQYNTLSSGTPSGVALDDHHTSHSSNLGSGAGAGNYKDPTSHGLGSGVGAGALGGGGLAAAAAKLKNGGRVTHNCTGCGKENDISKYFSQ